jgi:hypothetical protein
MSKTFEKLNETFGIVADTNDMPTNLPVVIESSDNDMQDDYEKTRQTLHDLIDKGSVVLDSMIDIAKRSEHPRTYEVAGQLIKTVADTAKELISLQKVMKELKKGSEPADANVIHQQNNIMFQGSTSDLMKTLRNNERIIESD